MEPLYPALLSWKLKASAFIAFEYEDLGSASRDSCCPRAFMSLFVALFTLI